MAKYLDKVRALTSVLKYFSNFHILRCENTRVDALSRLVTLIDNSLDQTCIEYLGALNIDETEKVQQVIHELS